MLLYMTSKIHHFVSVHVNGKSKKKVSQKKSIKSTARVTITIMQYNIIIWILDLFETPTNTLQSSKRKLTFQEGPDLRGHRRLRSENCRSPFRFRSYRLMRLPMKHAFVQLEADLQWHILQTTRSQHLSLRILKIILNLKHRGRGSSNFDKRLASPKQVSKSNVSSCEFLLVQRKKSGLCL